MKLLTKEKKTLGNEGKISLAVIIAIAAVVVVGLIFVATGALSKGVHKTFDSPKKYFAYVAKNEILGKKDNSVRSVYENLSGQFTKSDQAMEEKITVTIGEAGQSYLKMFKEMGVDLSWLNSAGLKYYVNSKNNDVELKTTLYLNEKEIINPQVIFDYEKKAVYAKIPELSKETMKYDLSDFEEQFEEVFGKIEKMKKAYPSSKDVEKLADKYLKLILAGFENVERERGASFDCDEVSQKCTMLRATIKDKDVKSIIKSICSEVGKDKDLKKLYEDYCKALELEDYEEEYDQMLEKLERIEDSIDDVEMGFDKITIELYVDGSSKVAGIVFNYVPEDGEKTTVKFGNAKKGSNLGFEFSVKNGERVVKLAGTGKLKGGKVYGDYALKVNGEKVLKLAVEKFDLSAFDDGYLKGHFTFTFEGDLSELTSVLPRSIRRYAGSISSFTPGIDLIADIGAKKHTIDFGLLSDGEELFRVEFKGTLKGASGVKIPSKAVDVTDPGDLKDFMSDLNFDDVEEALDKADVPSSYLKMLESLFK